MTASASTFCSSTRARPTSTSATPPAREKLSEHSIELAKQLGTTTLLAWGQGLLATSLLALGEHDAVPQLCEEAIRLAEDTRDRLANALAHRTLAEALARRGPADAEAAERSILDAIRIQQELGCRPELARSYMSYARLLEEWNRPDEARKHILEAIDLFRAMRMTRDLAAAEQEAAGLAQRRATEEGGAAPCPTVNGIGIVLNSTAPAMTLMSGAMLAFAEEDVEFDTISTTGAGGLIGMLYLAPKGKTRVEALKELPNLFVSDWLYRLCPVNFKMFHKYGSIRRAVLEAPQGFAADSPSSPTIRSELKRFFNDWIQLWATILTPSSYQFLT